MLLHRLDIGSCSVARRNNGQRVVSGVSDVVQMLIKKSASFSISIRRDGYEMTLLLIDACKSVSNAKDFSLLERLLYIYLKFSHAKEME